MTVVLAMRCTDGLVLGSDSQITESDRGLSYPARKLHPLGEHAAWGGSGARSVLHDLEKIFEAEAEEIVNSRNVARALQERVVPVLRHHYEFFVSDVPGEDSATPAAYVLAAGYSHGDPFIIKVAPDGLVGRYETVGFHAIGSGAPMAQQAAALLGHFRMADRSVDFGVLAVVRVLGVLQVSQPMVGGPLNVVRMTPDGWRLLDDDELGEIHEEVAQWESSERDLLDSIDVKVRD